jgi:hypothetical protein
MAGAALGLLILPVTARAQGNPVVTPPITTRTETNITLTAPPPDPKVTAENSVQGSEAILMGVIVPPPVKWANDIMNLPDIFRQTPRQWTIDNDQVKSVEDLIRKVALGLSLLALIVLGTQWALGQSEGRGGRIVMALVLVIGEVTFWSIGIDLNNQINNAIAAPDLAGIVKPNLVVPTSPQDAGTFTVDAIGSGLLSLVYAIVLLMLTFTMIGRLALIDVFIAIGPLAMVCWATEQSERFAARYIFGAVGLLFSQVAVVLGLKLAGVLFGMASGVAGALIGIAVLLALKGLPGMFMSAPRAGGGGRMSGMAISLLLRRLILRF